MEKCVRLLTAAMTQNLPKTLGHDGKISSGAIVDMVDDLMQLSAALDLGLVSGSIELFFFFYSFPRIVYRIVVP